MLSETLISSFDNLDFTKSGWISICDALAKEFDAVGTAIFPVKKEARPVKIIQSKRLDRVAEVYVKGGWYLRDVRERGLAHARQRGYTIDSDFTSKAEIQTLPYYKDFLRPNGLGGFLAILFHIENSEWIASIQFPKEKDSPSANQLKLVPQIRKLLEVAATNTLADNRNQWIGICHSLNTLNIGLIATDMEGTPQLKNEKAEMLLEKYSFKQTSKIISENEFENISGQYSHDSNHQHTVNFSHTLVGSNDFDLVANFSTIPAELQLLDVKCVYQAILIEVFSKKYLSMIKLKKYYGLTKTELIISEFIIDGNNIKNISYNMKISEGNIRQHLKRIFRKLQVSSQAQLLSKIFKSDTKKILKK